MFWRKTSASVTEGRKIRFWRTEKENIWNKGKSTEWYYYSIKDEWNSWYLLKWEQKAYIESKWQEVNTKIGKQSLWYYQRSYENDGTTWI